MNLLSLDISTNTGYAVFKDNEIIALGVITLKSKDIDYKKSSAKSITEMLKKVDELSYQITKLIHDYEIDEVVIEQTNKGRARYTQKFLEWLHYGAIRSVIIALNKLPNYMDSSEWRKLNSLNLTDIDKKHNKKVSQNIVKGKITKKHLSVRLVNNIYKLDFKIKDNDKADAILLGRGFLFKNKDRA